MNANLLCFENTHFGAAPSSVPVACVPVCAVCGADNFDEGDSFELNRGGGGPQWRRPRPAVWIYLFTGILVRGPDGREHTPTSGVAGAGR